jgi:hypothetical protein
MTSVVPQSEIVYFPNAAVAHNSTVLADCAAGGASGAESRAAVAPELARLDPSTPRAAGELGGGRFLVLSEPSGLRFACLAHASVSDANGFEFLVNLQSRWVRLNGAGATAPNPDFGRTEIASQLSSYNSKQYAKIALIKDQAQQAQEAMSRNITLALERGEAIDEMSEKAENLKDSAQTYHREATKLKEQLCWAKWRWRILAAIVLLVVIFAIVWFACGLQFESC